MELSIIIAKIIGIIYCSFGIGLLLNGEFYKREIPKMVENTSFLLLGGFIAIIFGVFMIQYHNIWEANWTLLITIIGWIALIKGVSLLAFPTFTGGTFIKFFSKVNTTYLGVFLLLFGIVFWYLGMKK